MWVAPSEYRATTRYRKLTPREEQASTEALEFFDRVDRDEDGPLSDDSDRIWNRWPKAKHIVNTREEALKLWSENKGIAWAATKSIRKFFSMENSVMFDWDDYRQTIDMALWGAALTYNEKRAAFSTYAWICCRHFTSRAIAMSLRHTQGVRSLNAGGEGEYSRGEMLALLTDPSTLDPWQRLELSELWDVPKEVLKPRSREMFIMHNVYGMTLEEVGIFYNISRERVRQVETISLRKLRAALQGKGYGRSPSRGVRFVS